MGRLVKIPSKRSLYVQKPSIFTSGQKPRVNIIYYEKCSLLSNFFSSSTIFRFQDILEGVSTIVYLLSNLCLGIAGPLKRWT